MRLVVLTSKLVLLTLIVISIESLVWVGPHNFENHYLGIIKQKYDRLFNTSPGRIIIIGGSSGAFGIDSDRIESYFNKPVVNMSLHAGIKLKYLLDGISPWVQKDDLVVLSAVLSNFESRGDQTTIILLNAYSHLSDSIIGNDYILWLKVQVNYVQNTINRILIQSFFNLFFEKLDASLVERVYEHRNFNERGDIVLPDIPNRKIEIQGTIQSGNLLPYNRKLLTAFSRNLQSKGSRLVVACPPLYEPEFNDLDPVHNLFGQLGEISGLEIISLPEDYVFSDSLFFDTSNHLNSKGKVFRTQQLIADLERYLATNQ